MDVKIYIGDKNKPYLILDNDVIISAHVKKQCSPVQTELPISTLEVVFKHTGMAQQFSPSDYPEGMKSADNQTVYCKDDGTSILDGIEYAQPVHIYPGLYNLGYMFVKSITRTGKNEYTLIAQNKAGIFEDFKTPGILLSYGSYENDFWLVNRIIEAINYSNMPDNVKAIMRNNFLAGNVKTLIKSGYIPAGTVREVVQQLLFAYGANIIERTMYVGSISQGLSAVDTYETAYTTMNNNGTVEEDNTYNNGEVEYPNTVSEIVLSEYSLSVNPNTDNSVWELLFDNTEFGLPTDENYIYWDGLPMSHIKVDNTILEYDKFGTGYNVKGVHKVFGKRALASKIERRAKNPNSDTGSVVSIDSYAVTALNSNAIMNRLKAFYFSNRKEVHQDFVRTKETEGRAYEITDSFGNKSVGFISDLDVELSNVSKAKAVLHTDWSPYNEEPFSRFVVLTGSGTWTVPDGVTAINVVLVGGGAGGSSGLKGSSGKTSKRLTTSQFDVRKGGKPGICGAGGKIRSIIINNPDKKYTYSCGKGGAGGAVCTSTTKRNEGKSGSNTVFGGYSSAYGNIIDTGIENAVNGFVYGAKLGSSDGFITVSDTAREGGDTYPTFADYYYYNYFSGGKVVSGTLDLTFSKSIRFDFYPSGYCYAYTGARGGSAVKVKGAIWTNPYWKTENEVIQMGNGGNGAAPSVAGLCPTDTGLPLYGWGGGGGNGGGAGGDAGHIVSNDSGWDKFLANGKAGVGGNGGAGGKGADGCVIIYY